MKNKYFLILTGLVGSGKWVNFVVMGKKGFLAVALAAAAVSGAWGAENDSLTVRPRNDGLYVSARGMTQSLLDRTPRLEFRPGMKPEEFAGWRDSVQAAMARLMKHPEMPAAAPKKVAETRHDGYRVEKWEAYPMEKAVVSFLVLVPDGITDAEPGAAVLCIPGFGGTKEYLSGVKSGDYTLEQPPVENPSTNAMAREYAKVGLVAVAVDNVSFGEQMDLGKADYLTTSRLLLEADWSYLGFNSFQQRMALEWLKKQPYVDPERIGVSGFSLGTEPMMAMAMLDGDIKAFVYNDFLCRTRERILVLTAVGEDGRRPFPNSLEHLIPGFLLEFDFPDIVAAMAPRPVLMTEGGLDRDFELVGKAYELAGAQGNAEWHHYPKYADPADRKEIEKLPEGLDLQTFFRLVNCDSPSHGFKTALAVPWMKEQLSKK